jgi:hypothetical protein
MKYWSREDTQYWIVQLENRVGDIDYYLQRTLEWCENNGVWDQEKIFSLTFVTVLWVCNMREENVSRQEIYEMLGIKDWDNIEDAVMELGDRLSSLDFEDMLTLVANTLDENRN